MAADKTPAFARTSNYPNYPDPSEDDTAAQEGMYIVDVFAHEAFKAIYPVKAEKATVDDPVDLNALAAECYQAAQAMINARNNYLTQEV